MSEERNLPSINDIVNDLEVYGKMDSLNVLLNQEPPKQWISEHPFIKKEVVLPSGQKQKVPYQYLPIDKVEYLLRKIFKAYKIEITSNQVSFNGVVVTVRVHYKDIVTGEWMYHDGIGASQLQTARGTSPADLNNINNGAVSMAYPHAKTLAIKDACDMFGKLFGADINRRDTVGVQQDKTLLSVGDKKDLIMSLLTEYEDYIDSRTYERLSNVISQEMTAEYNKAIKYLQGVEKKAIKAQAHGN